MREITCRSTPGSAMGTHQPQTGREEFVLPGQLDGAGRARAGMWCFCATGTPQVQSRSGKHIFFYAEIIHSEWKQTQITLVCELYIPHTIHRSCSKFKYKEEQKQQVWVLKYTLQPSQLDCLKVKFTLFSTTTLYFLSNEMTLVLQSSGTMMRRESLLVVCMATLPHTFNAKIKYWYIAGQSEPLTRDAALLVGWAAHPSASRWQTLCKPFQQQCRNVCSFQCICLVQVND